MEEFFHLHGSEERISSNLRGPKKRIPAPFWDKMERITTFLWEAMEDFLLLVSARRKRVVPQNAFQSSRRYSLWFLLNRHQERDESWFVQCANPLYPSFDAYDAITTHVLIQIVALPWSREKSTKLPQRRFQPPTHLVVRRKT